MVMKYCILIWIIFYSSLNIYSNSYDPTEIVGFGPKDAMLLLKGFFEQLGAKEDV